MGDDPRMHSLRPCGLGNIPTVIWDIITSYLDPLDEIHPQIQEWIDVQPLLQHAIDTMKTARRERSTVFANSRLSRGSQRLLAKQFMARRAFVLKLYSVLTKALARYGL